MGYSPLGYESLTCSQAGFEFGDYGFRRLGVIIDNKWIFWYISLYLGSLLALWPVLMWNASYMTWSRSYWPTSVYLCHGLVLIRPVVIRTTDFTLRKTMEDNCFSLPRYGDMTRWFATARVLLFHMSQATLLNILYLESWCYRRILMYHVVASQSIL